MTTVEVRDGDRVVATVTIAGDVPGLFVVDCVARLALAARRIGWTLRLPPDVGELVALCGLPLDRGGQPERREQPRVEEVVQPDEPPA